MHVKAARRTIASQAAADQTDVTGQERGRACMAAWRKETDGNQTEFYVEQFRTNLRLRKRREMEGRPATKRGNSRCERGWRSLSMSRNPAPIKRRRWDGSAVLAQTGRPESNHFDQSADSPICNSRPKSQM